MDNSKNNGKGIYLGVEALILLCLISYHRNKNKNVEAKFNIIAKIMLFVEAF